MLLRPLTLALLPAVARATTTGTSLCPPAEFGPALDELARHLRPGTVDRAGGPTTLARHYVERFRHPCINDGAGTSEPWPKSKRRSTLIVDMTDGTTGTRFLRCACRHVGLRGAHNAKDLKTLGTRYLDGFDLVADSPVPYLTDAIVATHAPNQTVFALTIRDPWDWHAHRLWHGGADSWRAAHGGCARGFSTLGEPDAKTRVPRDLLAMWAWALCVAGRRRAGGVGEVTVVNFFDDPSPGEERSKRALLRIFRESGRDVAQGRLDRAWNQCAKMRSGPPVANATTAARVRGRDRPAAAANATAARGGERTMS